MVTLGLVCLFVSFILLIMGLMAWGAATKEPTTDEKPTKEEANEESLKILTSIAEVTTEIKQANITHGLQLNIADELWRDNPGTKMSGVNMTIILDTVLDRGLVPDGFEQQDGYRIYRYNQSDQK